MNEGDEGAKIWLMGFIYICDETFVFFKWGGEVARGK
jgi:hypothetical protein